MDDPVAHGHAADVPVATLAANEQHGAEWLSLYALAALEAAADEATAYDEIAAVARDLRAARPSMCAVATRIDRAMADADERTVEAVAASARTVREAATGAAATAADAAASRIADATVLTLSRSGTVAAALDRVSTDGVVVLESRPGGEGVAVAESLADGHDVTLTRDAAIADCVATDIDAVLVGGDTVLPDGSVINKVGTRTVAAVAAGEGVPVFVACTSAKVAPAGTTDVDRELRPPAELYDGDESVAVYDPTFDRTPAALVDAVVTERGALDAAAVHSVAETHATAAEWDGSVTRD